MSKSVVNSSLVRTVSGLLSGGDSKSAAILLLVYAGVAAAPYIVEGIDKLTHDTMEHGYCIKLKFGACEFYR